MRDLTDTMPQPFSRTMTRLEEPAAGGHIDPMKLDSAYFNKIRIDADAKKRRPEPSVRACDMPGCDGAGTHRAPKGRNAEGEYFWFCLDHVRQYNKSYNYFSGMNDAAVQAFQREAMLGHRPTWQMGMNGKRPEATAKRDAARATRWAGQRGGPLPPVRRGLPGARPGAGAPQGAQHGSQVAEHARA